MATPDTVKWSLEAYAAHNEALRAAEDKFQNERDRRYGEVSAAKEEAVKIALANAEKAVAVAERNAERWRDNANEWRAAMTDRERMFLHKNMGIVIGGLSALALLIAMAEKFIK